MRRSLLSIVLSVGLLLPVAAMAQSQEQKKDSTPPPAKTTDSKDQKPAEPATEKKSTNAEDNPFPEDVSQKAAEEAKRAEESGTSAPKPVPVEPGESSSSLHLSDLDDNDLKYPGNVDSKVEVQDRKRASEDVKIGKFYMDRSDWKGAYNRFKDALAFENENVDAVYGMAEAAERLALVPEAVAAYKKCLEMDPDGPHAKASKKALKGLPDPTQTSQASKK